MFAGGIEGQIKMIKTAFPDHTATIDSMVAVQATMHATHTGPMLGFPAFGRLDAPVPPTGETTSASAMYLFTVSNGSIVSLASEFDQIGLLRQLGWTFTPPAARQPSMQNGPR